ncbi:4'-phosphopantetheinyl transferase family protein [Paracoccus tegillarcae]|nr:4-phosphopantetheinyl transferase [Paracoccus tegillarcae]
MLGPGISCAVVPLGQGNLLPAEAKSMRNAVTARRDEFASGRLALRLAIARAGYDLPADLPILSRADRQPDLPTGLVVSLAHAGGLAIALASCQPGIGLGVDIEPVHAMRPEGLEDSVQPFRFRDSHPDPLAVFCAKETLFKRQFPVTGRMLDFCEVSLAMDAARFAACIPDLGLMRGKWARISGFYLSVSAGNTCKNRHPS